MKWTQLHLVVTTHKHLSQGTHTELPKEFLTQAKKNPKGFAAHSESLDKNTAKVTLVLPDAFKNFDLHTQIRKNLPFQLKTEHLHIDTSHLSLSEEEAVLTAIGTFVEQIRYQGPVYGKRVKDVEQPPKLQFALKTTLSKEVAQKHLSTGVAYGKAMNLTRHLSDLPGNELQPKQYLGRIKKLATEWKMKLKTYSIAELEKLGAGAFLAVIRADYSRGSTIAKLSYKPKKGKAKGKIALVGKGLCYDTGGYNIKTGNYMFGMHRDMGGSATVLSILGLINEFQLPYEVDCYLAIAENLISPTAFRPNDVVEAMNGLSIEVVDTDAEGRMVLADTLALASEGKPELILDFATLTGSAIRAIGTTRLAVFNREESLDTILDEAAKDSGENIWRFPLGGEYLEALKSEVADTRQLAAGSNCDHIYAATFLSKFVDENIRYVHVDLSSDSNKGGLGITPHEVTASGVRFGFSFLKSLLTQPK